MFETIVFSYLAMVLAAFLGYLYGRNVGRSEGRVEGVYDTALKYETRLVCPTAGSHWCEACGRTI